MKTTFRPHLEILPPAQQHLWQELQILEELGLVLYGGTAIALQLGHRQSIDFDFFTEEALNKEILYHKLPFLQNSLVLQDQPETFTVTTTPLLDNDKVTQPVKLSFFGKISFGRLGTPLLPTTGRVEVASLQDLMATKLKVLLQRIEAKDYYDIAALIDAGISLSEGLAGATSLFNPQFQPSEALKALTYFEGGDLEQLSHSTRNTLVKASHQVGMLPSLPIVSKKLGSLKNSI